MQPRAIAAQVKELRKANHSYSQIAKLLSCSTGTVGYHCGKGQKLKTLIRGNRRESQRRALIRSIKHTRGCKHCPENDPYCLDFHHKHSKIFGISEQRYTALAVLLAEIAKCDVVCVNCHRHEHNQTGSNRSLNAKEQYVRTVKMKKKCPYCEEGRWYCLDFHHQATTTKIATISNMCRGRVYSLDEVKKEIAKCVLVCGNCHRKLHQKERLGRVRK